MIRKACFLAFVLATIAYLAPSGAASKSAEYTRFDVRIQVREDGTYHVTETQQVRFSDGPFSLGHREIPLGRTEGITNVAVSLLDESGKKRVLTESELSGLADAPNRFNVRTTS